MKYLFLYLIIIATVVAEEVHIEFIFSHCAEVTTTPRLVQRETRMEVKFDTETLKGELKSYSPFSDSFQTIPVTVKAASNGVHFLNIGEKGVKVLSFGLLENEATYSNSTVQYGVSLGYQLYGKGRFLEKR